MTTTTTTTELTLNDCNLPAVASLAGKISDEPEVAATVWKSSVRWLGGFRSESTSRDFTPRPSDEPEGLGGTDTAPNPVEQLLGALGNCLAVGYAANLTAAGVEIKDLRIEIEGDLDLHTFLGLNPEGNAGFETIRATVHLDTDGDEETVRTVHEQVTSTSPVGHTLARPIDVSIALGG
jgi:uncharacterized OsmC-like protein